MTGGGKVGVQGRNIAREEATPFWGGSTPLLARPAWHINNTVKKPIYQWYRHTAWLYDPNLPDDHIQCLEKSIYSYMPHRAVPAHVRMQTLPPVRIL